jgi:hypothetical protein
MPDGQVQRQASQPERLKVEPVLKRYSVRQGAVQPGQVYEPVLKQQVHAAVKPELRQLPAEPDGRRQEQEKQQVR